MDFSKKWKRSTNWTHTKRGILHHTVSQSAIPCEQPENPIENNTSSYPLSQGSDPKFLHIKQNVIPHKCTSRSCQTLNQTSHQSCQVSLQTISQSVKWAFPKNILELSVIMLIFLNTRVCQSMYATRNFGNISSIF